MQPIRDDPCLLFALPRESAPFHKRFRPTQEFPAGPSGARFCGTSGLSVLVAETGVGQGNVAGVLDWLLAKPRLDGIHYEPQLVIFAGFAGALSDTLRVGDVVVAEEIRDEHGGRWPTTWPKAWPDRWPVPLQRGRLLTVDRLIASPEDKNRLGKQYEAIAVEMESALFAKRCCQAGVPFTCVRAISDDIRRPVSHAVMTMLEAGFLSPWLVVKTVLRHPSIIPELWRLGRDTRHAARQLALALVELLTLTIHSKL